MREERRGGERRGGKCEYTITEHEIKEHIIMSLQHSRNIIITYMTTPAVSSTNLPKRIHTTYIIHACMYSTHSLSHTHRHAHRQA